MVNHMKKAEKNMTLAQRSDALGVPMTYHSVLFLMKIFLTVRCLTSFVMSFFNAAGAWRTTDQVFYVLMTAALVISLAGHDRRSGVISLFVFMALELGMNFVVYFAAAASEIAVADLNMKMFSWVLGSAVWAVPTFLYYRKRWKLLQ